MRQDWRTLFHFILSIVYAEPREVGFDPTMTLVKQDDEPARYDILVRSEAGEEQIYRTLELLHDQGAEYLVGRGTRVWKAVKIENGEEVGDPVVLKDAWVDHHREREGSINARVRESAIHSTHRGLFDMGLLTILSHGDVFVAGVQDRTPLLVQDDRRIGDVTVGGHDTVATDERGDVESATQEGASGNYIASGHDGFTVQEQAPGDDIVGDRGVTAADKHLNDDPANSQLLYQVHYRIVYKEVGRPLGTLTSLYSIFKALREVTYSTSYLICRICVSKLILNNQIYRPCMNAAGSTVISASATFSTLISGRRSQTWSMRHRKTSFRDMTVW